MKLLMSFIPQKIDNIQTNILHEKFKKYDKALEIIEYCVSISNEH